jgi:hypothetical protein
MEWVSETVRVQGTKITPCSRYLLEKLVVTQLEKKFHTFY